MVIWIYIERNQLDALRLFFEHLAAEWDVHQPADREEKLDRLVTAFDGLIMEATTILEVGTGTGGLMPILRKHNPTAKISQVDFANTMLMCAQANCNGNQLIQADAHQLPFGPNSFDVVVCHNSFPHFRNKKQALQSLRSVLRSGGQLLILHEISREKVNEVHRRAAAVEIHRDLLPENDEMRQMLTDGGFSEIQINDGLNCYTVVVRK